MTRGILIWSICLTLLLTTTRESQAASCGDPPDMLIVLDRSGSMSSSAGIMSKWLYATAAVGQLVSTNTGQIRFGLMLFPSTSSSCGAGKVNVPVSSSNVGFIAASLAANYPGGSTPIATSLQSAHSYLSKIDPGKTKYVLLVTDGGETCGGVPINQVAAMMKAGIKTYVVGFGSGVSPSQLNSLAYAGGTGLPGGTKYYKADSSAALKQALKTIASKISCCGNGILDQGEMCDPKITQGKSGACPTKCNDGNPCTVDAPSGSGCKVGCASKPLVTPKHNDKCCPPGATALNDNDCPAACGNGVLETGESCDPKISAGAGKCKTVADCDDKDICTADTLSGSACNMQCKHTKRQPDPLNKDGCCPPGNSINADADCLPNCGPDSNKNCVNLCQGVNCPDGQYCYSGKCKPWPKDGATKNQTDSTSGGDDFSMTGSGCSLGAAREPAPLSSLWIVGLVALLALRRRETDH